MFVIVKMYPNTREPFNVLVITSSVDLFNNKFSDVVKREFSVYMMEIIGQVNGDTPLTELENIESVIDLDSYINALVTIH